MGMSLSYWGREAGFNKKRRTTRNHFNGKSQEITGLQYWAYFNGGLNLREAGFNRKRRVARTHFNRKFHIYNIWPASMGEI